MHASLSLAPSSSAFNVVERLWFADETDEVAEQAAARSMAAAVATVVGLRPFPIAAQRLISAVQNPNYRISEIVRIIEPDPTLAARVLQGVNSAAYFLVAKVTSIRHAVALLGARNVGEIAAALTVLELVEDNSGLAEGQRLHMQRTATLARVLAAECGLPLDAVYSCALLHDIGKLLMLQVQGDEYAQLLRDHDDDRDMLHILERGAYGYDHAVLGGHALRTWGIPDLVATVVSWHHQPARAFAEGGTVARLVSLVRLADRLSYDLAAYDEPDEALIEALARDESATYLRISGESIARVWDELQSMAAETAPTFNGRRRLRLTRSTVLPGGELATTGETVLVPACRDCGSASHGTCPRCRAPLCRNHAPLDDDLRCVECEREYDSATSLYAASARHSKALLVIALAAMLGAATLVTLTPLLSWIAGLLVAATLPLAAAPLVGWRRESVRRRAFLDERYFS
ncbi:MAG: HDOD domain-containing protein [Myxococcales bacterium]|nr:HDOD domain-containing protein [Myxococcales bacterium]